MAPVINEHIEKLQDSFIQRDLQERSAIATTTSEVLTKLNISIENLPQKCQQLLQQASTAQTSSKLDQLNPMTVSLYQSREITEKLDDEYEILKLRQKNEELQVKIDRNNKFLEQLRIDLANSRESLSKQNPNPETVQDYCRQMKQKVASYEESCEKAQAKFSKLSVPEQAMPKSLATLATSLAQLCEQAASLRRSAEDIALARQAREDLHILRKLR